MDRTRYKKADTSNSIQRTFHPWPRNLPTIPARAWVRSAKGRGHKKGNDMETSPGIHRSSVAVGIYFDGFLPCLLLLSPVNRISIFGLPRKPRPVCLQRASSRRWISQDFLASFHPKHSKSLRSLSLLSPLTEWRILETDCAVNPLRGRERTWSFRVWNRREEKSESFR